MNWNKDLGTFTLGKLITIIFSAALLISYAVSFLELLNLPNGNGDGALVLLYIIPASFILSLINLLILKFVYRTQARDPLFWILKVINFIPILVFVFFFADLLVHFNA